MFKVYDDLFADDFLVECYKQAMCLPWRFDNIANRRQFPTESICAIGSHQFFGFSSFERMGRYRVRNNTPDIFFDVLEHFMGNIVQDMSRELVAIDHNLQVMGQNGTTHRDNYVGDGRDETLLFFPHYRWDASWGGAFQIVNDDDDTIVEQYYPKPGRILYFDGSIPHRGMGPSIANIARISIAFRLDAGVR